MGAGASTGQLELATKFSDLPKEEHAAHAASGRWGELEAVLTLGSQALDASKSAPPDDASTADARAIIAKHMCREDGGTLDKNAEPPAELLKSLAQMSHVMQ